VREPQRFAVDAGLDASPYYIDQFAVEGRDWPRGGTTRIAFPNPHLQYALTWFALAAALIGVWANFSFQDPPAKKSLGP
jgi:surfeit locus 1 family protein